MSIPDRDTIPTRLCEYLAVLHDAEAPLTRVQVADRIDLTPATVGRYARRLRDEHGIDVRPTTNHYALPDDFPSDFFETVDHDNPTDEADTDAESEAYPDLESVVPDPDAKPDPSQLSERERYIATELQTGTTVEELAADIDETEPIVTAYLRDLRRRGWQVYIDETAGHVALEGDHALRSSEHKGTRTRKANRWWELRHSALVREFKSFDTPSSRPFRTTGREDWVLHMTDLHAGDIVRREDGAVVYSTSDIPSIIDYITERGLDLARRHRARYDTGHLLWGGDFVTGEGIYESQFEDLDAWLDEQHDILVAPLMRQVKAYSEFFPEVQIVCQVGNHGRSRASGVSRQANADLILYKTVRNTIAQIRDHDEDALSNVEFKLGEARAYRNFPLRGGDLRGHLRHGQHRKPQAETSARQNQWRGTLDTHDFDVAYMGHFHISGRIPWDGPPIICSPSPKPAGEYVEQLQGRTTGGNQGLATAHGVSDDGLTAIFPIDDRDYSRDETAE